MVSRQDKTVIGGSITIDGEIDADDGLVVYGRITGSVKTEQELAIEAGAEVEADVSGEAVIVSGALTGAAEAKNRVEITPDGRMTGDIRAPRILIADGAHYKGNIDMS